MELSKNAAESHEMPCDISLCEDGEIFKAYTVSIAYRDLLFYTDKGTLAYDVNTIGSTDYVICLSIDADQYHTNKIKDFKNEIHEEKLY